MPELAILVFKTVCAPHRCAQHERVADYFATERLALHWVQRYVSAFGGDPAKVTM
jgi:carboxylesterase type B